MPARPLAFLTLLLLLAGCGDVAAPEARPEVSEAATPQALFDAMRRATLEADWAALYALQAPSERRECEVLWERMRDDPTRGDALDQLASQAGTDRETLATMSLEAMFAARNRLQMEQGGQPYVEMIQSAQLLEPKPVEGDPDPDVIAVPMRIAERDADLIMKREEGRWWMWRALTDLVSR